MTGNIPFRIADVLDVVLVATIVYYAILLVRETRTIQLIRGMLVVLVVTFLAQVFRLGTLNWILEKVLALGVVALMVIFQPELRNLLRKLGTEQIMPFSTLQVPEIAQLLDAIRHFSEHRVGSIIALERTTPLGGYAESGRKIDGAVGRDLLAAIFFPGNPLHDGAVIIQHNRISAAGCILPMEPRPVGGLLGTRHLSAMKLSEETDALVVVTSEETGRISIAQEGKLNEGIGLDELRGRLERLFMPAA